MSYLYFISDKDKEYIKIGVSKSPKKRLKQLQTGNPKRLSILRTIDLKTASNAFRIEGLIHKKFQEIRIRGGEWFLFTKDIEYFIKNYDPTKYSNKDIQKVVKQLSLWVGIIIIVSVAGILILKGVK